MASASRWTGSRCLCGASCGFPGSMGCRTSISALRTPAKNLVVAWTLSFPEREASRHVKSDRHCAIASGRFIAFGSDTIGMGYLQSDIGMIEDAAVELCD